MNQTELADKLNRLRERIGKACDRAGRDISSVRTVVVTKTHSAQSLQAVIDAGIVHLGENRVREIEDKAPQLHGEHSLHLIGHLQSNKVKKVVPLVDWIESIDSEKLFRKVESQCKDSGRKLKVLVQVNTSGEDAKSGCERSEAQDLCGLVTQSPYVDFRGLMTIGPWGGNETELRKSFIMLRGIGETCSDLVHGQLELSMGMSDDFEWAIEEGSTNIRVGSLIMGARN